MKTCIIFNASAQGEKAARCRKYFEKLSKQCCLKATQGPGDGHRLAAQAVNEGFDIIAAAGGDGTLNEVANGIADTPGGLDHARLAVLPLGTVNVFAKDIKIPSTPEEAWRVILGGKVTSIDLGQALFQREQETRRQYFVQLAGAGLDARAIELVDWEQKKKFGPLAYCIAGIKAVAGKQHQIIVQTESQTIEGQLILIGNGRYYGGRFPLFPHASFHDGLLDLTVFPHVNFGAALQCGWGLLTNRLHTAGGARHAQTRQARISCVDPVRFQLDGDNTGSLPLEISVLPKALRVLIP